MNIESQKDIFFSRDKIKGDLRNKSVRGASIRALGNGIAALLNMGSMIVLARLLVPSDFGLLAMVVAVTELGRAFMEFGLGTATVQREEITHEEVSALFWINVAIGAALMVIVAGISPAVSWFYGDNRLLNICLASSATFLFSGLTVQHRSLLERQMNYGYLAIINILSTFVGACIAVLMAIHGFGVWALVCREIISSSSYATGAWLSCRWLPSSPNLGVDVRASLRFGANLSGFTIIRYFTQNLDRIMIGRVYGATPLGFYGKAFQMAMMPVEQVRGIILPIGISSLSALQSDPERYRRFYSKLLSVLTFIYMPGVVFMAIHSDDIVRLLLGEQWVGAVPYFRIFAIVGFVTPILSSCHLVMVSYGKTERLLKCGMLSGAGMVIAVAIGIRWGAIGVAYAYLIATYSLVLPLLLYAFQGTPINIRLVINSIALPVVSSVCAGAIMLALLPALSNVNIFLHITIFFMVAAVSYIGIWLSISKGRQQLLEFFLYATELFRSTNSCVK